MAEQSSVPGSILSFIFAWKLYVRMGLKLRDTPDLSIPHYSAIETNQLTFPVPHPVSAQVL